MSFVDNEHKKLYVITYKELLFTFIVFCVILFVLYPKDLLKEQILSEKSNYDLSILYLKNLLEHSPEDESLMLILAEQSLRSGNKDLSLRLLELLLESKNKEYKKKATLLSYELQKEYYFYMKDKERMKRQKKVLESLFHEIFLSKMYNKEESLKWYKESMFVNDERATYFFLKKILMERVDDVKLLEQAYYLAKKYKDKANSFRYINLLQEYDAEHRDRWIEDEYYMYITFKQYTLAERLLQRYAGTSQKWKIKLAEFYLMQKYYKKSSQVYTELFKKSQDYAQKRDFFYKSVQALQAGNYLKAAAKKVQRQEDFYFKDRDVRAFMLKLYIATGSLDRAQHLAKKILDKELQ